MIQWSLFLDYSGRFSISRPQKTLTFCGVAIPTDQVMKARQNLKYGLPGDPWKWANADEKTAEYIFAYLRDSNFVIVILHIETGTPEWKRFIDCGKDFLRKTQAAGDNSITRLNIPEFLKGTLLFREFALLVNHCLKNYGAGIIVDSSEQKHLLLNLIADREFNNRIVIDLLNDSILHWGGTSNLRQFGMKPIVEMSFRTEQDEPLLLLPDHVAGPFCLLQNYRMSAPPKLSRKHAETLVQDYRSLDPPRFFEKLETFAETSISLSPPWPTSKGLETAP